MRLYRCRLDIRACHPASEIGDRVMREVTKPRFPAFTGSRQCLGRDHPRWQVIDGRSVPGSVSIRNSVGVG